LQDLRKFILKPTGLTVVDLTFNSSFGLGDGKITRFYLPMKMRKRISFYIGCLFDLNADLEREQPSQAKGNQ